jgi:DNA polymerase type B, organellar and viral
MFIFPLFNLRKLLLNFINSLESILKTFKMWINKDSTPNMRLIVDSKFTKKSRMLTIAVLNPVNDLNSLLLQLYNLLNSLDSFTNIKHKKVLITAVDVNNLKLSLNKAYYIKENSSFEDLYRSISEGLERINMSGFNLSPDTITYFEVLVINLDCCENTISQTVNPKKSNVFAIQKRGIHIASISNKASFIKPIKVRKDVNITVSPNSFATMDIETMDVNGIQTPVLISLTISLTPDSPLSYTKIFIIDHKLEIDIAVNNMWKEFFQFINTMLNRNIQTIFVHNLGGFDGIFIYKQLLLNYNLDEVSSVIDEDNKFINIKLKTQSRNITWLDSYRIFPVSLDQLANIFGVPGKLSKYNPDFNKLEAFNNNALIYELVQYCKQDTLALFEALYNAQTEYFRDYNVDLTTVVSTSNLSLRIFRTKFLNVNIPILKHSIDKFIRSGYFGGATEYYKAYGKNLKYYDVNSLYPFVMKNPMPLNIIKHYDNMTNISLDSVFGFFLAEIECPDTIQHPILPYKHNGSTIFPHGKFKGVYFSEELKVAVSLGYNVTLISGYEFSKVDLFSSFVEHFYQIKKISYGAEKFIAKLHLNTLYGVFGRKQELIQTINIHPDELEMYLATHVIKNIIKISDDVCTILVYNNLDDETISKLNFIFNNEINNNLYSVKSNVASNILNFVILM